MQMAAHDLRAPLMSIKLALEVLRKQHPTDRRHDGIKAVTRNIDRLIVFIEDLLTVDKLESGHLEIDSDYVDLYRVAEDAIDTIVAKAAEKDIVLKNQIEGAHLLGDKLRLQQVLTNLVSNAIKYSPENSEITVTSKISPTEVLICVNDSGPGIAPEKQSLLFDKFYQVAPTADERGFGLGLAICKLIVSTHGGRIGLQSEEGKGSTFWFTLPADNTPD